MLMFATKQAFRHCEPITLNAKTAEAAEALSERLVRHGLEPLRGGIQVHSEMGAG